jgi:hypothetical protein
MDPAVLMIVGVVAFIAFLIWLVWYLDKRRREAWMAAANDLGLQYSRRDDSIMTTFAGFKLFGFGRRRRTKDILKGKVREGEVVMGDYQYVTGHGKHQQLHKQTLCILKSPSFHLPHCFLRKQQRFFDFMGKLFGGKDIDFEDDPEFSKAFVLQGEDEIAVRTAYHPGVRGHFMRYKGTSFTFEAFGDTFLIHNSKTIKPQNARDLLNQALEIAHLFG